MGYLYYPYLLGFAAILAILFRFPKRFLTPTTGE
jgi:hypothetical protein